jgi:hypothetical protein
VAWGIDATDAELEDCPDRRGGARGVVFRQPEGDGLAVAARGDDCAAGRAMPPLPPVAKSSIVVAPVAIAISAIREQAEKAAPRNFAGKADNPISQILENADIGWSAVRGPMAAAGDKDVLTISTPLNGKLNVTGSLSSKATGALGDALGSVLGGDAAKRIGAVNIKNLNASAEIKGNVVVTSRPKLAANWHLEPNLGAQVNLGDTNLNVSGAKVNVPAQVKPLIDKNVGEQINIVSERIRNDPSLRENAKLQWAKACRSIPLQGSAPRPRCRRSGSR